MTEHTKPCGCTVKRTRVSSRTRWEDLSFCDAHLKIDKRRGKKWRTLSRPCKD